MRAHEWPKVTSPASGLCGAWWSCLLIPVLHGLSLAFPIGAWHHPLFPEVLLGLLGVLAEEGSPKCGCRLPHSSASLPPPFSGRNSVGAFWLLQLWRKNFPKFPATRKQLKWRGSVCCPLFRCAPWPLPRQAVHLTLVTRLVETCVMGSMKKQGLENKTAHWHL